MPEFNLCQQAFVLSMRANQLSRINGDQPGTKPQLEKQLYAWLIEYLPQYTAQLGTWEIVWGPATYSDPGTESAPGVGIPDNTAFVARKVADPAVYVVAIAGTNFKSRYGWVTEDGGVGLTTAWRAAFTEGVDGKPLLAPYGNPGGAANPCISRGTAAGVRILLGLTPDVGTNPADPDPVSLPRFLAGLETTGDETLIFAGHSLGGALSPTLALALFNPEGGPLDRAKWKHVRVLPTAGATPGNADFAEGFSAVFPPEPAVLVKPDPARVPLWNRDVRNTIDIVPLAWVPEQLDRIPPPPLVGKGGLYPDLSWTLEARTELRWAVDAAIARSKKGAERKPLGGEFPPGPYARLPGAEFDCPELGDTHAKIVALVEPPKGPDGEPIPGEQSFLQHWAPHHSTSYIESIFEVRSVFPEISDPPTLDAGYDVLGGREAQ